MVSTKVEQSLIVSFNPQKGYNFVQHQAPISPGSSGGPLLNAKGEVVAINTFFFEGQNLNGAIPINYVKPYLQDPPKMTYEEYVRAHVSPSAPPQPAPAQPGPRPPSGAWKVVRFEESGISFRVPANTVIKNGPHYAEMNFGDPDRHVFLLQVQMSQSAWPSLDDNAKEYVMNVRKRKEDIMLRQPGSPRTISSKLVSGDGYLGYYVSVAYALGDGSVRINVDAEIHTRRTVYYFSGSCLPQEHGADCGETMAKVFESFQFPN